ncbi:MAG: hypothetical protein KF736_13020 [Acidobacteria bacterium]|nr:hypothetical protein [Acidobacteriota bacterium]MCW5950369.1 hypothetical protein [Pyrinomonadaceae bacterium]
MITNSVQLDASQKQLGLLRDMLDAMREQTAKRNPGLFHTVSEGYLTKIKELEDDIISYLRERPVDAPLTVKVQGPGIRYGIIKASLASKLISGFQSAVYALGASAFRENPDGEDRVLPKGLRSHLGLDLVATAPGSFILAMDLRSEERPLFPSLDPASIAIEKLINHVNEIRDSPDAFSGDREALRGLKKMSELIRPGIESITVDFHLADVRVETSFNPTVRDRIDLLLGAPREGEKTIIGQLIAIDIETKVCVVHPENQPRVDCTYQENIESDLIAALRKQIEMAGEFVFLDWPRGHFKITVIERFRVLENDDD